MKISSKIKKHQYYSFILIALYFLFRLMAESEKLPDYESYKNIFADPNNFSEWNIFFTSIIIGTQFLFSYEAFRIAIFALGALLFGRIRSVSIQKETLLLIFISCIILLEFYMIRLRAGLCIFLFYLALHFFNSKSRKLALIVGVVSFGVHPGTFLTLGLVYWPQIAKIRLNLTFMFINICLWILFLVYVNIAALGRGIHLDSEINSVRIIALIALPMIFYLVASSFHIRLLSNSSHSEFIGLITLNIALLALYSGNFFLTSGEAIIRIYSLVSGPSMLYGLISHRDKWTFNQKYTAYLALVINSLFFINTVYL